MSEKDHSEAAIAVFAYKRPLHTARLIDSLLANEPVARSPIFAFCDGARAPEENQAVGETRRVIRDRLGTRCEVVERDTNCGLAASIIGGVTELSRRYGRVIVLEDDLVLHSGCIAFLNAALRHYADDNRIWHVNAYRYPIGSAAAPVFSRLPSSWGWATWERAWAAFEPDAARLARQVRDAGLVSRMDFGGRFPYYAMLKDQVRGRVDSWAIRWYASVLIRDGLSIYPNVSQVINKGMDGSGVHSGTTSAYDVEIGEANQNWPVDVVEDQLTYSKMQAYFGKLTGSVARRLARRLKRRLFTRRRRG